MLIDSLRTTIGGFPGSPDRDQLDGLLERAERYVLSDEFSEAASATAARAPETVETALDRMSVPSEVFWVEYGNAGREAREGERVPDRLGALIAMNPEMEGESAAVVTAWRFPEGDVHHSYVVLRWRFDHFAWLAHGARRVFGGGPESSAMRIMDIAEAFMPDAFAAELSEWSDFNGDGDGGEERARKSHHDAVSEHLFLVTALLLMSSGAAEVRHDGAVYRTGLRPTAPAPRRLWLGERAQGFVRSRKGLLWYPVKGSER